MPQQHTTLDQVNFLHQWFVSWSEMQREDFLPILVQAYQPKDHINGLLGGIESLHVQGRRPSLFDCQMKLFQDWFTSWTEADRNRLLEQFREEDPDFMTQYDKAISGEDTSQLEDTTATPSECGEESQNPPSSVSSPPSTLPRSHSPHDSGLDEPPSDSDHTEPHSLDSSHDIEAVGSTGTPPVSETQSPASTDKTTTITITTSPTQSNAVLADGSPKSDNATNGIAEVSKSSKEGVEMEKE